MKNELKLPEVRSEMRFYHPDPFASWGHFELKKESFPSGIDGFRSCVEEGR
ncbi:MAG: hypothetical protein R2744_13510 [Bacteroidales bacterium]